MRAHGSRRNASSSARDSFHCSTCRRYGWAVSCARTDMSNTARAPEGCSRICQSGQISPEASNSSVIPSPSRRSSVGGWKVEARRSCVKLSAASSTQTSTPARASKSARQRPTGPPADDDRLGVGPRHKRRPSLNRARVPLRISAHGRTGGGQRGGRALRRVGARQRGHLARALERAEVDHRRRVPRRFELPVLRERVAQPP